MNKRERIEQLESSVRDLNTAIVNIGNKRDLDKQCFTDIIERLGDRLDEDKWRRENPAKYSNNDKVSQGLIIRSTVDIKIFKPSYGIRNVDICRYYNVFNGKIVLKIHELDIKEITIAKDKSVLKDTITKGESQTTKEFLIDNKDLFIDFGNFAKNYKSPKKVSQAFELYIERYL